MGTFTEIIFLLIKLCLYLETFFDLHFSFRFKNFTFFSAPRIDKDRNHHDLHYDIREYTFLFL